MKKESANIPWTNIAKAVGVPVSMLLGGLFGYKVMPEISGYEDVEGSKRQSGVLNAATSTALYTWLLSKGMLGKGGYAKFLKHMQSNPKVIPAVSAGVIGEEVIPIATATATRSAQASKDQASAAMEQARASQAQADAISNAAGRTSLPESIGRMMKTPTAQGMGIGAGAASGLGLLTGLTRKKTEEEERTGRTRPRMIANDIVKYMIPALVAGGVIGSFNRSNPQSQQSAVTQAAT